jgi:CubicO group peptidase (beta-lactamase class C family)
MHATDVNLDESRWNAAIEFAADLCRRDEVPAIAMCVGNSEGTLPPVFLGRQRLAADSPPLREDAIFLIASITKPIVATAVLMLVERGQLALGDRVCDVIPEFGGAGRYGITVRHLLTHTSGLPDMLPNNVELRAANAPLSAFVAGTCGVEPDFAPGRGVQYQSMGFALLGEIVFRVTGTPCRDFLRGEIFTPLNMNDTELGAPDSWFEGATPTAERIAEIRLVPKLQLGNEHDPASNWHWNSRYWRSLGAPWGGLLTTPADLARFARMLLNDGEVESRESRDESQNEGGKRLPEGGKRIVAHTTHHSRAPTAGWSTTHHSPQRILSPAAVSAATRNQLDAMRDVPEVDRRCRPWGLGWRLNWPDHSANFGDLLGPRTYGHWGATGTVMWIDPDADLFAIILSTQPQEPDGRLLSRLSNCIAAASSSPRHF